jgi:hypothetical protein
MSDNPFVEAQFQPHTNSLRSGSADTQQPVGQVASQAVGRALIAMGTKSKAVEPREAAEPARLGTSGMASSFQDPQARLLRRRCPQTRLPLISKFLGFNTSISVQPSSHATADDRRSALDAVAGRAMMGTRLIHISEGFRFAWHLFLDSIQLSECCWGSAMLDSEFKRQRAQVLRELVEKTNDPFIKRRLLALMSRYDDSVYARTPLTPVDLKFQSQGTGSEQ